MCNVPQKSHALGRDLKDPLVRNSFLPVEIKEQEKAKLERPENSQIDVSLIDASLSLSYEDRIDAHESARVLMEDLREAGKKLYATGSEGTA